MEQKPTVYERARFFSSRRAALKALAGALNVDPTFLADALCGILLPESLKHPTEGISLSLPVVNGRVDVEEE